MNFFKYYISLFVLIFISSCSENKKDYTQFVNAFIGTDWHGHTFPGATHPFGMVQLSPDTRVDTWDGSSGYHYSDHSILGFSHTHFSGTGKGGGGDVMFMPTTGEVQLDSGSVNNSLTGYRSKFSHDDEFAEPGYYKVKLQDDDILAELTTTPRVGFHKYSFPTNKEANIILDLTHGNADEVDSLYVEIVSNKEISGFREAHGSLAGAHKIYFVAQFSQPFINHGIRSDGVGLGRISKSGSKDMQCYFQFDMKNKETVMIKVALSRVGVEGARKNMEAELPDWDFEAIKNTARDTWNKELSKIEIKGGTKTQKRTFYTAMYHSFIHPDIDVDVDRKFLGGDHKVYQANDFDNYTTFSMWDTFRGLHPLYTIIQQERTNMFIRSFLAMHDNFGYLPMMEFSGNERFAMIGYHSLPVIADAYAKGIRDYDVNKALEAMKKLSNGNREGKKEYLNLGFIPYEKFSQSVSRTLEYSYDDWTVTRLAKDLSDSDFHLYNQRGQFYRNLYDESTGFMRPKSSDYQWLDSFDPMMASNHVTEGNAYQYTLFVPQDIEGLIMQMGGDDKFEKWLDVCFTTETDTTKMYLADVTGRIGQYAHGNEPSHHMAYLYNYVGAPWKTQQRVRQIMDTLYSDRPDGISGNEDAGQMSAWYVLNAMGFYSVTPGMDYYVIGSPLFDKAIIHLENGKQFTIKTENNSKENRYIQSASLNGKPYFKSILMHQDIMKGGEIKFVMGAVPNKDWAVAKENRPYSEKYKSAATPRIIFDDISFLNTMEIEMKVDEKDAVIRYTLDGTLPNETSPVYKSSIILNKTTKVRARTFKKGLNPGYAISLDFKKLRLLPALNPKGLQSGLKYEYKEGYALKFSDTEESPILKTGVIPHFTIKEAGDKEVFSYTYKGYIKIPKSGVYTLYSESNDGSLLYIDGQLLVNNDLHHKVQEGFSKVALKSGWHSIKLEYFQMGGGKALRVSWKGPGLKKQEIPTNVLFHIE